MSLDKLVKNLISPKQLRVYHRALPVYRTASRFKLIKSKTKPIRNNLNSLLNQNKANFSQGHTRHTSKSFSVYWQTHRINKYKLSNLNSLPKKSQKNKFKIVNNRLNKYKLINSNELKLNQIELNKKIVIAKFVLFFIYFFFLIINVEFSKNINFYSIVILIMFRVVN